MADIRLFAGFPSILELIGYTLRVPTSRLHEVLGEISTDVVKDVNDVIQSQYGSQQAEINAAINLLNKLKDALSQLQQDQIDKIKQKYGVSIDQATIDQQVKKIESIKNVSGNYFQNMEVFKQLGGVLTGAGINTAELFGALFTDQELSKVVTGSFDQMVDANIVTKEGAQRISQLQNLRIAFNILYGRYDEPDMNKQLEQFKTSFVDFIGMSLSLAGKTEDEITAAKENAQKQIEAWLNANIQIGGQTINIKQRLADIISFYKQNPELAVRNILFDPWEVQSTLNKMEELPAVKFAGKQEKYASTGYAPIQDVFAATFGLKTKQQTGIVVDTLLQPNKSLSDFVNYVAREVSLGELLYSYLGTTAKKQVIAAGSKGERTVEINSMSDLISQIGMLSNIPHFVLQHQKFKDIFEEAKGSISINVTDYLYSNADVSTIRTRNLYQLNVSKLYEIMENHVSGLSDEERSQFKSAIDYIVGSMRLYEAFTKGIDIYGGGASIYTQPYRIQQVAQHYFFSEIVPFLTQQYNQAVYREDQERILKLQEQLQGIFGFAFSIDDKHFGIQSTVQQAGQKSKQQLDEQSTVDSQLQKIAEYFAEARKSPARAMYQLAEQLRRYEQKVAINNQLVMQADAQKAVDKQNNKVIIASIMNALKSNSQYEQVSDTIRSALYNALFSGAESQFKMPQLYAMLQRTNAEDLRNMGFSNEFIEYVKQLDYSTLDLNSTELIAALRKKFTRDIDPFVKLLYESMRSDVESIASNKNFRESIRTLQQYQTIQEYINIGNTLGLGPKGDQMLRQSIVQHSVTEIIQDYFQRYMKDINHFMDQYKLVVAEYTKYIRQVEDIQQVHPSYYRFTSVQRHQFIDQVQDQLGISSSSKYQDKGTVKLFKKFVQKAWQLKQIVDSKKLDESKLSSEELQYLSSKYVTNNQLRFTKRDAINELMGEFTFLMPSVVGLNSTDKDIIRSIWSILEGESGQEFVQKQTKVRTIKDIYKYLSKYGITNETVLRFKLGYVLERARSIQERDPHYQMMQSLTMRSFVESVDTFLEYGYAGSYQLADLVEYRMQKIRESTVMPYVEIASLTDLQSYRAIREPKKGEVTRAIRTTKHFEDQLKGEAYQKIRQLVQGHILTDSMQYSDVVPPIMHKQFIYAKTTGVQSGQIERMRRKALEIAKGGQLEEEELEEEEAVDEFGDLIEDEDIREGEGLAVYQTGWTVQFSESQSGGLFITPGVAPYFTFSEQTAQQVQSEVFESKEAAMQSLKLHLGSQLQNKFMDFMYRQSKLGLPIGLYTTARTGLRREVRMELMRQIFNRAYQYTKDLDEFRQFDIMRAVFLSQPNQANIDDSLRLVLLEIFDQNKMITFFSKEQLDLNKQSKRHILKFLREEVLQPGKLSNRQAEILKRFFKTDDLSTIDHRKIYNAVMQRLSSNVKQMHYNFLQYNQPFDLESITDYLFSVYKFNYRNATLWLVPHQLTDPISMQSPNIVGATVSLRPYGHTNTPLQEWFNPWAAGTDAIRVVNSYGAKAPTLVIDANSHGANQVAQTVEYIQKINKEKHKQLLRIHIPGVYDQDINTTEAEGLIIPMLVLPEKDQRLITNLLGTNLNLAGDAYMLQKQLFEQLRIVKRGPFGELQYEPVPDPLKLTGIARSKGMVTFKFDREIKVKLADGTEIYIGGVINTQGKRKNKLAEFGLGQLRAYKYIYGERQLDKVLRKIDVTQPVVFDALTEEISAKISSTMLNKLTGQILVKEGDEWAHTPLTGQIIFHKVYAYTGKSHQPYWTELSNQAAQVLPQLALFKQQGLMGLLLSADSDDKDAEKIMLSTNMVSSLASGAQAGQIQQLIERGYIGADYAKTYSINRSLGIRSQKRIGLIEGLRPFVNVFSSIKQQGFTASNSMRLRYMQEQLGRAGLSDPRLIRTRELLETLSDILLNQRIQLETGNIVYEITQSQAEKLQNFVGEEILVPAIAIQYFRSVAGGASFMGLNEWSTQRLASTLVNLQEQSDNIVTMYKTTQYRKGGRLKTVNNQLQFIKMFVPRLFNNTGTNLHLSIEAETFMNMFQGIHSLLYYAQTGDERNALRQFNFYAARSMQLGNIQMRSFTRQLAKRHGVTMSGLHATARADLGGVRLPEKLMMELFASQIRSGVLTEERLEELNNQIQQQAQASGFSAVGLSDRDIQAIKYLAQHPDQMSMPNAFEKWAQQALYITHDATTGRVIVHQSPSSRYYTNKREIYELLMSNVPIFYNKGRYTLYESSIRYATNEQAFKKQQIEQLFKMYAVYKAPELRDTYKSQYDILSQLDQQPYVRYASQVATNFGEMWAYIQRHPLIGHMPHVRIAGLSQGNTIDVPLHVAEAIAGDDDGDMINLLPYILIDPSVFQQRRAIISTYGTYGYTLSQWMNAQDRKDQIQNEIYQMKTRQTKWLSL